MTTLSLLLQPLKPRESSGCKNVSWALCLDFQGYMILRIYGWQQDPERICCLGDDRSCWKSVPFPDCAGVECKLFRISSGTWYLERLAVVAG